MADQFPDGQLYVNLQGFDAAGAVLSPGSALRGFLTALGVQPRSVPAEQQSQVSLYRSLLAGKRVLVVLDNARDAEQVRTLLPGAPGCVAIVTSRDQLTSLVAAEGAVPLVLDMLSVVEARQLLIRRLGADRVAAEPRAVDEIINRCVRLPLALTIAAARAAIRPRFALAVLAGELRDARHRLDTLAAGDAVSDVRAVFSWSYDTLSAAAARLFRLLGLHAGPDISTGAAASLTGIPVATAAGALAELVRAHLVAEPAPGRFAVHDLLHAYAIELAHATDTEADRAAAQHRLLDHYLHAAHAAALLLNAARHPITLADAEAGVTRESLTSLAQARAWFTAEHPVLVATIAQGACSGLDRHAWQLAWTLVDFFSYRALWHDQAATQRTALDAARRLDDRNGQAHTHCNLARAYAQLDRHDDAHLHLERALRLFGELGDDRGRTLAHLGNAWVFEARSRYQDALDHARSALALQQSIGDRAGQGTALNAVGWYHALLGEHHRALVYCQRALALHQEFDSSRGQASTWHSLGYAHHHLGRYARAIDCYQHALTMARQIGDRYGDATVHAHLGDAHHAAGDAAAARREWMSALASFDDLGHPDAEGVRARLRRPVEQRV